MTTYTPAQLEAWAGLGPWCQPDGPEYGVMLDRVPSRPIHSFLGQPIFDKQPHDDWFEQEMANAALIAAAPDLARLVLEKDAEIARLKAKLTQTPTAEWFYDPDCMESCHFTVHEVIDSMELPEGKHVVEVSTAAPLPSIWCAVTVDYKGGGDEPLKIDEFETEEAARQAMKETSDE